MRFRFTAALIAAALLGLVTQALPALTSSSAAAGTSASTTVTAPSSAEVNSTKAQAAALEQEIAEDSERAQNAGEQYDQDNVVLGRDETELAKVRAEVTRYDAKIRAERLVVRAAAIEAYVSGDSAAAQFGAVLSTNIVDEGTVTTYAGVASHRLGTLLAALDSTERHLRSTESQEAVAAASAADAAKASARERDVASGAAQANTAALHQVNGHLAELIEQQEAAAAAAARARAEAAARAAAQARAAAAAKARAAAEAAERRAEAQAAAAANVATTVAAADPSSPTVQTDAAAAEDAANAASGVDEAPLVPAGTNPAGLEAVQTAEQYLGVPYVWGGASSSGVDCSGLTMLAWASAGVALTHSAYYQYEESQHISLSQLEPGDLVFYWYPDDGTTEPISHVAMYVGSGPYGTQTLIQAPETGEDVSYVPMYYAGFVGAGRP